MINPLTLEVLERTLPALNLNTVSAANRNFSRKANNVDPDKTGCYQASHLELQGLKRYLYWSVGMKELTRLSVSGYFTDTAEHFLPITSKYVTLDMRAQRRFWSAYALAQSDQNLHWAHVGYPRMQTFFKRITKTLIRPHGSAG